MSDGNTRSKPFPTTRWNLISRVSGTDPVDRDRALEEICGLYHPPVRAYIRNLGHSPHDADDLTQGFFAEFLRGDQFSRPDPARGSLRGYLRMAVKQFLAREHRRAGRQKRGGHLTMMSMDAEPGLILNRVEHLGSLPTPDLAYERQWATTLLQNVLDRLESHYRENGQEALYDRLSPFVRTDAEAPAQRELAEALGLSEELFGLPSTVCGSVTARSSSTRSPQPWNRARMSRRN
jgi:RNA polymerase sigma-70 factor (ECF subfamily)